jgi:colicin import membrane protein
LSDRRLPEPRIRDEFRHELRARLMREAAVTLTPKRRDTAWTSWSRPAFAIGLAALVLVFGAGVATANSVPGDLTFGVKRAIDEVRIALTFDDVQRVRVLADISDQRLGELQRVADSDDKAPAASEAYAEALTRFRVAVDTLQENGPQEQSDEAQQVVEENRDKHEIVLEEILKGPLPENAKPNVERAIEQERRSTRNTRDKKGDQQRDGGQDQNRSASPRGTTTPRPTERTASPRATQSPRPTERN